MKTETVVLIYVAVICGSYSLWSLLRSLRSGRVKMYKGAGYREAVACDEVMRGLPAARLEHARRKAEFVDSQYRRLVKGRRGPMLIPDCELDD